MHRDIKLDNILVSVDERGNIYDLKLADFGKAVKFTVQEKFKTFCGTIGYIPPEMLQEDISYNYHVDIWSLGIVLYTMIAGELPFFDQDKQTVFKKTLQEEPGFNEPGWAKCSKEVKDLVKGMLDKNPEERMSMS